MKTGTGIESYFRHGQTEDSVESVKCNDCDGFGFYTGGIKR